MSKLTLLLALYAAVVSTLLLTRSRETRGPAAGAAAAEGSADLRKVMHEARALLRDEVKDTLKNVDWRLSRMDDLARAMQEGVTAAQRTAEEAASGNYGRLEAMEETVKGLGKAAQDLEAIRTRFAALEQRLEAVEKRPAQVIREVQHGGAGPAAPTPDVGPTRPRLPVGPQRDPAEVAAEIAKARENLQSDDAAMLFGAIDKVREHRVMDAVPRLLELLAAHAQEIIRGNAAAALGKMKVADAVPALAEALVDKSELVAQEANGALREITGFDTELDPTAGIRSRRAARSKIKEWWRAHEAEVRERLAQPKPGGG